MLTVLLLWPGLNGRKHASMGNFAFGIWVQSTSGFWLLYSTDAA